MKAHLNPFAPERVQRLLPFDPSLAGTSWEAIESRWLAMGRRASIVGRKGSGKTTFLKTFAQRLQKEHHLVHLFFREGDRQLGQREWDQLTRITNHENTLILVDGEGHLCRAQRTILRKLSSQAAGYLAARHHRSRLPALLHLKSSPQLAETLLARIDPEEADSIRNQLPSLLRKKSGNLREVWLSLYDEYATHH